MRARARAYVEAFEARTDDFEVIYASKALPVTAAYRLLARGGAVGGRRLRRRAVPGAEGRRRPAAHLHARQQQDRGRAAATRSSRSIGYLVLDSFAEIERAERLLSRSQDVLIRVTPGIKPSTHSLRPDRAARLQVRLRARGRAGGGGGAARARRRKRLNLVGIHAHIGSQIFELEPYTRTIELLADFIDFDCRLLNVGGGLGIAYTAEGRAGLDRGLRGREGARRAAGVRPGAADPDRAGPLAGRQRRHHRVPDRHDQGDPGRAHLRVRRRRHVRQPAPDALRRRATTPRSRTGPRRRARSSRRSPACTASPATS